MPCIVVHAMHNDPEHVELMGISGLLLPQNGEVWPSQCCIDVGFAAAVQ